MGQFIYDKHMAALSPEALAVLADEQKKKPVAERQVNQFGSTIITNIGHRQTQAARAEAAEAAAASRVDEQQVQRGKCAICLLPIFCLGGFQVVVR